MQNLFSSKGVRWAIALSALFLVTPAPAADPVVPANPLQPVEPAAGAAVAAQVSASTSATATAASIPAPAAATGTSSTAVPVPGPTAASLTDIQAQPIPASLGGAWKGTFTRRNLDQSTDQETYLVEVDVRQPAIRVSLLAASEGAIRSTASNVLTPVTPQETAASESPSGRTLEPFFTPESMPARWDGHTLEQSFSQNSTEGRANIALGKRLSISLEPDGRHARFNYEIKQIRISGRIDTKTAKMQGSGILSRVR